MPSSVKDVAITLLFAVVAMVSAVALLKTAASPFGGGSFGPAQWALFVVTLIGSTCAFLRSLRYWASVSVFSRWRSTRAEETPDPEQQIATPRARMHPVLDDLTWATLALAILAINGLAVWAVVITLRELLGDSATPVGWLIWQLALLTAAAAGLGRLSGAIAAELRDRARRRRRNAVHVVTGKLMNWPGDSASAGRRGRQVAAVAATAALASVSLANASGPLLEPDRERAAVLAGQAGEREGTTAHPGASQNPAAQTAAAPDTAKAHVARSAAATVKDELARRRTRGDRRAEQARLSRDTTAEQPIVAPEPPPPPPPSAAPIAPQPTPGANERATRERRRAHKRRAGGRRRHSDEGRRRANPQPQQPPPTDAPPQPTPPAPSPPGTPCDPAGDPAGQPPCGEGYGAPPPE